MGCVDAAVDLHPQFHAHFTPRGRVRQGRAPNGADVVLAGAGRGHVRAGAGAGGGTGTALGADMPLNGLLLGDLLLADLPSQPGLPLALEGR